MARVWSQIILLFKKSFVREAVHVEGTIGDTDHKPIDLMSLDTKIGIVTAAGYTEAEKYYGRLHGLLEATKNSDLLTDTQRHNLVVMGQY